MTYNLIRDATRGRVDLNATQKSKSMFPGGNQGDASIVSHDTGSKERMTGTGVKKLYKIKNSNNNSKIEDRSVIDQQQDRGYSIGNGTANNKLGNFDFANE